MDIKKIVNTLVFILLLPFYIIIITGILKIIYDISKELDREIQKECIKRKSLITLKNENR